MPEFSPWPKTPRLFRDCVITEKIDGTNAAIGILEDGTVYAQSRKRLITPDDDNFGFAKWVQDNAETLIADLGPGLHFGEWWGAGIQRGYGVSDKRFSLFNVARHAGSEFVTLFLDVVPVLYRGPFYTEIVTDVLESLCLTGSVAAPGFWSPEGVCVFHEASRQVYKVLLENDDKPKSVVA